MRIIISILVFLNCGTFVYCGDASLSGTSYSIMLDDAVVYMDGYPVDFFFTTYDGNRYTYPYYVDTVNNTIYYSRELKKNGSLYYMDYFSVLGGSLDDYGEISLNLGSLDTNANGIDDICELDRSINIQVSGNWYSALGEQGSISGTMIRNNNSQVGYYNLYINNTWAGNVPASGEFYVGTLSGTVIYSNTGSDITVDYTSTFIEQNPTERLQSTYEIINSDKIRINGVDEFPTTDFIRNGNKYSAVVVLSDGNTDTFWPDYQKWYCIIQDLNDSDGDGIPDLSDPPLPDSDDDGVVDTNDNCPGTPLGESVNAQGCSNSQLDSDNDGIKDDIELDSCTDVYDADTDDDGISDGIEDKNQDGILDAGETDPCDPDTDGDGIQDGTESGLTLADIGSDTDTNIFQPDLDPLTTTDSLLQDSDGDGYSDSDEDKNHNGKVDAGESNPYDDTSKPSRAMPWIPLLLLN
jgi:hypothetical protein